MGLHRLSYYHRDPWREEVWNPETHITFVDSGQKERRWDLFYHARLRWDWEEARRTLPMLLAPFILCTRHSAAELHFTEWRHVTSSSTNKGLRKHGPYIAIIVIRITRDFIGCEVCELHLVLRNTKFIPAIVRYR